MLALPPGPQPAPQRQIFIATAAACAAGAMLIGTMMATWLAFRASAPTRPGEPGERDVITDWLPAEILVPEVAANMALIGFGVACVMAQWAVYAGVRRYVTHVGMALGLTLLVGLGILNAQVYIWVEMGVTVNSPYGALFYAATITMMALLVGGLIFTIVAAFRFLGGRTTEVEILSAHAMYWYFLGVAFALEWFVIYVQK
jgi:heme/copper-type cytochrome/quinol oxidase subunit 3